VLDLAYNNFTMSKFVGNIGHGQTGSLHHDAMKIHVSE